jgi:hypothetical protein
MPFSRETTVDRTGQMATATTDECRNGRAIGAGVKLRQEIIERKKRDGVLRRNCPWGRR